MKSRFRAAASLVGIVALALPALAPAEVNAARLNQIKKPLTAIHNSYSKMPPAAQKMLDGQANANYLYSVINRLSPELPKPKPGASRAQMAAAIDQAVAGSGVPGP